jgi:hypothetical protein
MEPDNLHRNQITHSTGGYGPHEEHIAMRRKPLPTKSELLRSRINFTVSNMVIDALYAESSATMIPMSRIVEAGVIDYINRQRRGRVKGNQGIPSAKVPT